MPRARLLWKLYPSYLIVIVACILATGMYTWRSLDQFYISYIIEDLEVRARLMESRLDELLEFGSLDDPLTVEQIGQACTTLADLVDSRMTVIDAQTGRVLGDSMHDAGEMTSLADRPEVVDATNGLIGRYRRYDSSLRTAVQYVAIPYMSGSRTVAVVRTALPLTEVDKALGRIRRQLLAAGFVVAILAAGVGLYATRRISRPLEQMQRGAERFAQGDFTYRLKIPDVEELASLAGTLNRMADDLDEKIRTITKQNRQEQTILSSMIEGVVAVDANQRIISANEAAIAHLGIRGWQIDGRNLQEAVRNNDLHRMVGNALQGQKPELGDVELERAGQRCTLYVHVTPLTENDGTRIGVLIVFHDVTRLRQVETIRRDFVANVSHELKTPITSIKGFVETLQEGAISDPKRASHFLKIIRRQVDRLTAIIDDLLSLSRIEQESEGEQMEMSLCRLHEILQATVNDSAVHAREHGIQVDMDCPEDIEVNVNPRLLEQAVTNLLDNAIKYSGKDAPVHLRGFRQNGGVTIEVADDGPGIEPEHIPRLFERFYRVDKARSRKLGGTGLGLAIVKHIAQVHGGRIEVDSEPGKGSTFRIVIPHR